jgi:hypothetical protein
MPSVKPRTKPIKLGRVAGVLLLPLLLVGGVLSIPYTMVWRRAKSRRERQFANTMKADGRIIEWERFIPEMNAGRGTLIVERFSFKGPIRLWWTREDVYEVCPYPLVDWLTMARETSFDAVRDWCHSKYTSNTGSALLVDGSKKQWRTIRESSPLSFRDGIRYLEVPPPRRSS